ncbi:hypothetical protein NDU88_003321 [Pleurodeles waltl]|uniref:Uncharacterized protein n=1 Tax=Pleurodeles waltl TaxID=8319 RepID=A0AAV7TNB8_PLEWA|nr:hypothetical protein NDU88_003321 [Pleurodeles waltl]
MRNEALPFRTLDEREMPEPRGTHSNNDGLWMPQRAGTAQLLPSINIQVRSLEQGAHTTLELLGIQKRR